MTDTTQIPRKEAEALLVFLANDTLEGDERAAVEAAVAADPQLQGELDALRSIRAEMQAEAQAATPGEFGLARLMRDIDRETASAAPAITTSRTNIWKIAAAVAVALFVGQTVMYTAFDDDGYELAGGGTDVQTGPTLTVAFADGATEADIRNLLLDLGLVIVDGPSAIGLYVLAAEDDAAREAALARLTEETTLIDSAETGD